MKSMGGGGAFIGDVSQQFYVVLYSENHILRKDLFGKKRKRKYVFVQTWRLEILWPMAG